MSILSLTTDHTYLERERVQEVMDHIFYSCFTIWLHSVSNFDFIGCHGKSLVTIWFKNVMVIPSNLRLSIKFAIENEKLVTL